jgi:hypothetical protein
LQELDCAYGQHNVLIFGNLEILREFYSRFTKRALEDNDVVVLLSYYEPIKNVYAFLENAGIDVAAYKKAHNLFVEDSVDQFFGAGSDFFKFLKILDEGAVHQGKRGVCVLASADAFHLHKEMKDLKEYEDSLSPPGNLKNTSIICMYHAESFAALRKEDQDYIIRRHNIVVK